MDTRKTSLRVTMVAAAFATGFAVAQTMKATGREPQFENGAVKVWKSIILPNAPLPLHRHEHPRVIVALRGGTIEIREESGKSEVQRWQTGKAYWLPANLPGTRHQDVNVGNEPIEVMVVELQKEQ